jgi:hypothetical protein
MYTKNNYPEKDLIAKGIKAWYDEKSLWTWGSGFSSATGHYTQVCNKKFKCPSIGFICKQRQLYSFNR